MWLSQPVYIADKHPEHRQRLLQQFSSASAADGQYRGLSAEQRGALIQLQQTDDVSNRQVILQTALSAMDDVMGADVVKVGGCVMHWVRFHLFLMCHTNM